MEIQINAKQLTEEWFRLVRTIIDDPQYREPERQLAQRLSECGRVLNHLLLALNNATVVSSE